MAEKSKDQYSEEEAEKRLQAALRGSRVTGHKQMVNIPKKAAPRKSRARNKPKK